MVYASTHFAGVAGPGNTPPAVSAAPLARHRRHDRPGPHHQRRQARRAVRGRAPSHRQRDAGRPAGSVQPDVRRRRPGPAPARPRARVGFGLRLLARRPHRHQRPRRPARHEQDHRRLRERRPRPGAASSRRTPRPISRSSRSTATPSCRRPSSSPTASKVQAGQWAIAIGEPFALQHSVVGRRRLRLQPRRADPGRRPAAPPLPGHAANVRADQPRQLGRTARRLRRPRHRREPVDGQPRRGARHRLRDPRANGRAERAKSSRRTTARRSIATGTGTGKGFLGVAAVDITNNVRTQLGGYHDQGGVAVNRVVGGAPADQAGVQPGDVIQSINGKPVNSSQRLHLGDQRPQAGHASNASRVVARRQEEPPGEAGGAAGRDLSAKPAAAEPVTGLTPVREFRGGGTRLRVPSRFCWSRQRNSGKTPPP